MVVEEDRSVVASTRHFPPPSELMSNEDDAFFGPESLFVRLKEAQDSAFEELEDRITIARVVGAAILKGIVSALCQESSESLEAKESEITFLKESLEEKDAKIIQLEIALQLKEDEWTKSVEESVIQRYKLISDFLQAMDQSQQDNKSREMYVVEKEKELSNIAEHLVRAASALDAETKKAAMLERRLKEMYDSDAAKARQIAALTQEIDRLNLEQRNSFDMSSKRTELGYMNQVEFLVTENNRLLDALDEEKYEQQIEKVDKQSESCDGAWHGDELLVDRNWNEEEGRPKKQLHDARWNKILQDRQMDAAEQNNVHKQDSLCEEERVADFLRVCSNVDEECTLAGNIHSDSVRAQEWALRMEIEILTTILESYSDTLATHSLNLQATEHANMQAIGLSDSIDVGIASFEEGPLLFATSSSSCSTVEAPKNNTAVGVSVAEEVASSSTESEHIRDSKNLVEQKSLTIVRLESELQELEWSRTLETSVILAFTEVFAGDHEHRRDGRNEIPGVKEDVGSFLKTQLLKKELTIEHLERTLDKVSLSSGVESAVCLSCLDGYGREMLQVFLKYREHMSLKDAELGVLRSDLDSQRQTIESTSLALSAARGTCSQLKMDLDVSKGALEQEQLKVRQLLHRSKELETSIKESDDKLTRKEQSLDSLKEEHMEQQWQQHLEIQILFGVLECQYKDGINMIVPSNLSSMDKAGLGTETFQDFHVVETDAKSRILNKERSPDLARTGVEVSVHVVMDGENQIVKGTLSLEKEMEGPIIQLMREMSEVKRQRDFILKQKAKEICKFKRESLKETEKLKVEGSRIGGDNFYALKNQVSDTSKDQMDELLPEQQRKDLGSIGGVVGQRDVASELKLQCCSKEVTMSAQVSNDEQKFVNSCILLQTEEETSTGKKSDLKADETLILVPQNEIEKLKLSFLEVLKEKEIALKRTSMEKEDEKLQKSRLEIQLQKVKNDMNKLQTDLSSVHRQITLEFAGQVRCLLENSLQSTQYLSWRMHEQILRLDGAQEKVKHVHRNRKSFLLQGSDYKRKLSKYINNLQKAEEEVDLLGDEVDALLTVLEKVFTTLERYGPVFQHYPGMVELAELVRQEIFLRIDPADLLQA
ncbi:hypothetical protein O6H91_14G043900 [Diphasiastrum complanatum]|uniref:Uncharacterized protein n=3 Tax=Diphasiastrum complanatum TaxID=34168 RepID=A0ACC2BNW5_DIPCM|nr:hypothetical protein O6H91_14G043900 [Diphasiastrum complanatum]KAJ7531435.1 hypothetical protein O6H91_14G043900 [Diphasiastrum complanatum]KAJ7531436.1 hypothetical protein O6H91_14G043900 [Diphasiastrum complanatum]